MKEEWKVYKETKNNRWGHRVYEVSNLGRVKVNGEIVPPAKSGQYYTVARCLLHRVVAQLFIPNPENKPCVDHINTNRLDNRAENLRWVTVKENNNNPLTKQHQHGRVYTAERKRKISYSLKGKHLSEEHKQKLREAWVRRKKRGN